MTKKKGKRNNKKIELKVSFASSQGLPHPQERVGGIFLVMLLFFHKFKSDFSKEISNGELGIKQN